MISTLKIWQILRILPICGNLLTDLKPNIKIINLLSLKIASNHNIYKDLVEAQFLKGIIIHNNILIIKERKQKKLKVMVDNFKLIFNVFLESLIPSTIACPIP